ncbi:hypothetical protein FGO68_gene7521 [Halteria grandinella]|uniref:Peptidase S11 D-alanyl-D-alanine carboxypeptidase A N-terminal domain-containing protein n=1 Tax=Halteria grandinella TaxID=5974 RepID=A0A8J8NZV8_HALGN|nr:hypothetical protein FGO68_gene7521 [Halteria grandinella]
MLINTSLLNYFIYQLSLLERSLFIQSVIFKMDSRARKKLRDSQAYSDKYNRELDDLCPGKSTKSVIGLHYTDNQYIHLEEQSCPDDEEEMGTKVETESPNCKGGKRAATTIGNEESSEEDEMEQSEEQSETQEEEEGDNNETCASPLKFENSSSQGTDMTTTARSGSAINGSSPFSNHSVVSTKLQMNLIPLQVLQDSNLSEALQSQESSSRKVVNSHLQNHALQPRPTVYQHQPKVMQGGLPQQQRTHFTANSSVGFNVNNKRGTALFKPLFFRNRGQGSSMHDQETKFQASKSSVEGIPRLQRMSQTNFYNNCEGEENFNTTNFSSKPRFSGVHNLAPIPQVSQPTSIKLIDSQNPQRMSTQAIDTMRNKVQTQRGNKGSLPPAIGKMESEKKDLNTSTQTPLKQAQNQQNNSGSGTSSRTPYLQTGPGRQIQYSNPRKRRKTTGKNVANQGYNTSQYIFQRPSSSEMMMQINRKLIFETPAPFISASSWIIVDKTTGEVLFAKNENEQRQVASLTKIMTCVVILKLIEKFGIGEHKEIVKVLPSISTINGTTANILPGDHLSVWELLHGMMLPSGNDAAQALALHFGLIIIRHEALQELKVKGNNYQVLDKWQADVLRLNMANYTEIERRYDIIDNALKAFYKEMNLQAFSLGYRDFIAPRYEGQHFQVDSEDVEVHL